MVVFLKAIVSLHNYHQHLVFYMEGEVFYLLLVCHFAEFPVSIFEMREAWMHYLAIFHMPVVVAGKASVSSAAAVDIVAVQSPSSHPQVLSGVFVALDLIVPPL